MRGFGEIAERLRRLTARVYPRGRQGSGSGVIWSTSGLVVTNAHVARGPDMQVELWDGRRFDSRILARDARRDVAALEIDAADLESAVAGDSSALRVGELVIAVGNPLGFAGAVSTGVVHSTGRLPGAGGRDWIFADVQLAPGSSGGPLADARGRVVGINTAIVNGLGVALPANTVAEFLRSGPGPSLGVVLRPVPGGLVVLEVEPGGAAAEASLRAGDVLLMSLADLGDALDSGRDILRLPFLRGGARVRETVVRLTGRAVAA